MPDHRGIYRGIYTALTEDPDFLRLSAAARHVFLTVRLCPQNTPASLLRVYPGVLATQTGYPLRILRPALTALVEGRWIECEGPWQTLDGPFLVWIRNGLRYDPNLRLSDLKHRKAVVRALANFGPTPLVLSFCAYYEIASPFGDPPKALPRPSEGQARFGSPSSSPSRGHQILRVSTA